MVLIKLPGYYSELIKTSEYFWQVQQLNEYVSNILNDNKMPFFPGYTDHGISHVEDVLETEVKLISRKVIKYKIITDSDIAIIVCATFLHDIAMHLSADGFLNLIDVSGKYRPIQWFENNCQETSWNIEWENFLKEAKRFSDRELCMLFGPNELYKDKLLNFPG